MRLIVTHEKRLRQEYLFAFCSLDAVSGQDLRCISSIPVEAGCQIEQFADLIVHDLVYMGYIQQVKSAERHSAGNEPQVPLRASKHLE